MSICEVCENGTCSGPIIAAGIRTQDAESELASVDLTVYIMSLCTENIGLVRDAFISVNR